MLLFCDFVKSDLQMHFAAESELIRMKISTSESEAMLLDCKKASHPLWVCLCRKWRSGGISRFCPRGGEGGSVKLTDRSEQFIYSIYVYLSIQQLNLYIKVSLQFFLKIKCHCFSVKTTKFTLSPVPFQNEHVIKQLQDLGELLYF